MIARILGAFVAAAALALLPVEAGAFGSSTKKTTTAAPAKAKDKPASAVEASYTKGVAAIDAKDWNLAVFHFFKVVESKPTNADAQNWLGYSYRKLRDFDNAFLHYAKALEADPTHKGAHEYMGEAYLEIGDLAKAEELLAGLAELCGPGCEEYDELKEAVEKYKARS